MFKFEHIYSYALVFCARIVDCSSCYAVCTMLREACSYRLSLPRRWGRARSRLSIRSSRAPRAASEASQGPQSGVLSAPRPVSRTPAVRARRPRLRPSSAPGSAPAVRSARSRAAPVSSSRRRARASPAVRSSAAKARATRIVSARSLSRRAAQEATAGRRWLSTCTFEDSDSMYLMCYSYVAWVCVNCNR